MNDFDKPKVGWVLSPAHPTYHFFDHSPRSVCGQAFRPANATLIRDEDLRRMERDSAARRVHQVKWMCGRCDRVLNARHTEHHR